MLAAFALAASIPGNCEGLAGPHPGNVVVQRATTIVPDPQWQLPQAGSYPGAPVKVPFCRVEGTIEGNIGFELWLPRAWSGRMLGAGVGGDAGVFNYRDMSLRIGQGFATLTTDAGHKISQTHWMINAKARVDYEHRAVHLTTLAAKQLVHDFYGRPANRSYFLGCSGGGRQALKEMQNYPADYDGVIAGAPGPYMPLLSVRMMWFSLLQKHQPAGALTDGDWSLYEQAVTKACDGNDGVVDGIIENPLTCHFNVSSLACRNSQTNCLSAAKLAMLEAIIAPMRDEHGRSMDKGLLPGVRTRPGPPSPLLRAMWGDAVYNDPNWNEETFQRTVDLASVNRAMPELRADKTNVQPFIDQGGKAIIYQGWDDPSVNAGPTIDYYASLAAANGGPTNLGRSVQLFMVPGMYHCRGGPGADAFGGSGHPLPQPDSQHDILWALVDWVEQRQAPERIVAAKIVDGTTKFTRILCAFPKLAVYDRAQSATNAASYSCRSDPALAGQLTAAR